MKIDRSKHVPLYIQIKEIISIQIKEVIAQNRDLVIQEEEVVTQNLDDKAWLPGYPIPSEKELQDLYGVSRMTVRQAVNELVNEGLVVKKQGKGTFVSFPKLSHNLPNLTSFTEDIRLKGLKPQARILNIDRGIYPKIAQKMEVDGDTSFLNINRLRLINDEEVGIHDSYINYLVIEGTPLASTETFDYTGSIYEALENSGIIRTYAIETLEGGIADKGIAGMLGIKEGFPLLILERITYTGDNLPLEYVKMHYRADKYKYSIRLNRN